MQGFLTSGTDTAPIVPALEKIWADSMGKGLSDFNFRTVTSKFNELVYEYPIRIPERYALVIRWVSHGLRTAQCQRPVSALCSIETRAAHTNHRRLMPHSRSCL